MGVMVCEENDAKAITYQKLESCKRSILDDCYDKLVPEICPEEHQLRPHIFALNITVAMCDAGFMSDPYFYDHCESSRCRVTTKEVYDDYVLNQALDRLNENTWTYTFSNFPTYPETLLIVSAYAYCI